jgi:hypothetical protein
MATVSDARTDHPRAYELIQVVGNRLPSFGVSLAIGRICEATSWHTYESSNGDAAVYRRQYGGIPSLFPIAEF